MRSHRIRTVPHDVSQVKSMTGFEPRHSTIDVELHWSCQGRLGPAKQT